MMCNANDCSIHVVNSEGCRHGYCNHFMMCNANDCSIHVVNSEVSRHGYCNHVMICNVNDCSIHVVNSEDCRHGYCNHVICNVNVTFWQVTLVLSMMFHLIVLLVCQALTCFLPSKPDELITLIMYLLVSI